MEGLGAVHSAVMTGCSWGRGDRVEKWIQVHDETTRRHCACLVVVLELTETRNGHLHNGRWAGGRGRRGEGKMSKKWKIKDKKERASAFTRSYRCSITVHCAHPYRPRNRERVAFSISRSGTGMQQKNKDNTTTKKRVNVTHVSSSSSD
ncbi:hypothetical protein NEOLEDRAFT_431764 [Neolentinus lepideus HHB14362 ss-1]|uniref:Uncharacterized protein n=1 Tax=Neolentinus lepideus HHB14362 ss-1 TaxID=1314782 RepID=A0A165RUH2_9AGAM|nr:hypothetical protein NEOLEDRAFT_431764 [Neolentinus lepideus HHB14362 ss-1]